MLFSCFQFQMTDRTTAVMSNYESITSGKSQFDQPPWPQLFQLGETDVAARSKQRLVKNPPANFDLNFIAELRFQVISDVGERCLLEFQSEFEFGQPCFVAKTARTRADRDDR